MRSHTRPTLGIALAAVFAAQTTFAFEYPLSPEAIREAYFLVIASQDKQTEFFQKYKHYLPKPESGPYVSLIDVKTPFGCLVDELATRGPNYHADDAEKDYLGKPGCFRVHVGINFTQDYPPPGFSKAALPDLWKKFEVHLKQRAEVEPQSIHGEPIYYSDDSGAYGVIGANINLEYNLKKIDAGGLTTIDVDTPDGQVIETTFNLSQLR